MSRPALLCACASFAMTHIVSGADMPKKLRVYIGSFSSPTSLGIYLSELDLSTGSLTDAKLAGKAAGPSFLAIHPTKKFLYSVSQIADANGKQIGGVSAFAVDAATGN